MSKNFFDSEDYGEPESFKYLLGFVQDNPVFTPDVERVFFNLRFQDPDIPSEDTTYADLVDAFDWLGAARFLVSNMPNVDIYALLCRPWQDLGYFLVDVFAYFNCETNDPPGNDESTTRLNYWPVFCDLVQGLATKHSPIAKRSPPLVLEII